MRNYVDKFHVTQKQGLFFTKAVQASVAHRDLSVNAYINAAIDEKMARANTRNE